MHATCCLSRGSKSLTVLNQWQITCHFTPRARHGCPTSTNDGECKGKLTAGTSRYVELLVPGRHGEPGSRRWNSQ